jgi:hypothetical protein
VWILSSVHAVTSICYTLDMWNFMLNAFHTISLLVNVWSFQLVKFHAIFIIFGNCCWKTNYFQMTVRFECYSLFASSYICNKMSLIFMHLFDNLSIGVNLLCIHACVCVNVSEFVTKKSEIWWGMEALLFPMCYYLKKIWWCDLGMNDFEISKNYKSWLVAKTNRLDFDF